MIQDLDFLNIEGVLIDVRHLAAHMSSLCLKPNLDYKVEDLSFIYQSLLEISKSLEDVYIDFPCNTKK